MFTGWTQAEIEQYQARLATISAAERGEPVDVSPSTLCRWKQAWVMAKESGNHRLLLPGKSTGRKPLCELSADETRKLREMFARTNRAENAGSKSLAARMFARDPACTPAVRSAILRPRASKHSLPQAIRSAMQIAPDIIAYHRAPTNHSLAGAYVPGQLRTKNSDSGELERLRAGDRQSWDDASINFCVWVPWPMGGDKVSDKFGIKVGRFQLLAGIDDATDFCPGFSYVIRIKQSYRGADATSAMFRVWRDTGIPRSVMIEGGVWQSNRALNFFEQVGVPTISAKGRPHQKLIENYWNRLWSVLSAMADGQIGRFRGEHERENDLLMRCQNATLDPRDVFPSLTQSLSAIDGGIEFLNHDQVESKFYGKWTPADRYAVEIAANPCATLHPSMAWTVAPEIHTPIVRRGMVSCKAISPLGESFPYHFMSDDLFELNGRRVAIHFDPWASPVTATITALESYGDIKAGAVICANAESVTAGPAILRARDTAGFEVSWDTSAWKRAVELRNAQARAVRIEHRAMGLTGRVMNAETINRAEAEHEEKASVEQKRKIFSRMELAS